MKLQRIPLALILLATFAGCSQVKVLPGSYESNAQSDKAAVALYYSFKPPVPVLFSRLYLSLRSLDYKTDEKFEFSHKRGWSTPTKIPVEKCIVFEMTAPQEWSVDYIAYGHDRAVFVPKHQNPLFFEVEPGRLYWLGTVGADTERMITHDPSANRAECVDHIQSEYSKLDASDMRDLPVERRQVEEVYFF